MTGWHEPNGPDLGIVEVIAGGEAERFARGRPAVPAVADWAVSYVSNIPHTFQLHVTLFYLSSGQSDGSFH